MTDTTADVGVSASKQSPTGGSNGTAPRRPARARTNEDWWPNQLNLKALHQHSPLSNPMGPDFDYAQEFKTLDLDALKRDIIRVLTTSQGSSRTSSR